MRGWRRASARESGGSGADFDEFVVTSSPRLFKTAYFLVGDYGKAEDLLQLTYLRTSLRWQVAKVAPEAYARRILINLSRDRLRNLSRRPAEVSYPVDLADNRMWWSSGTDIESVVDRDALITALRRVTVRWREILVMRFFLDLSVVDTASALRMPEGTVKSATSRALSQLRQLLSVDEIPVQERCEN